MIKPLTNIPEPRVTTHISSHAHMLQSVQQVVSLTFLNMYNNMKIFSEHCVSTQ